MKLDPLRHLTNPLALLAVIAVNMVANLLPLGGRTTGEVSAMFPSLFTPAPYAFSIWALIYLGLAAYVVYQLLPLGRNNQAVVRIGPLFAVSCLLNIAWLFAWHFLNLGLSVIIMVALLLTLVLIYLRIRVRAHQPRGIEKLAVRAPFSIYLAWISVATIANVAAWLNSLGWSGWGISPAGWALLMLLAGALLGALALLRRNDIVFSLVIIWSLAAIAVQQDAPLVRFGAIIAALLLLALLTYRVFHARPAQVHATPLSDGITPGRRGPGTR